MVEMASSCFDNAAADCQLLPFQKLLPWNVMALSGLEVVFSRTLECRALCKSLFLLSLQKQIDAFASSRICYLKSNGLDALYILKSSTHSNSTVRNDDLHSSLAGSL